MHHASASVKVTVLRDTKLLTNNSGLKILLCVKIYSILLRINPVALLAVGMVQYTLMHDNTLQYKLGKHIYEHCFNDFCVTSAY